MNQIIESWIQIPLPSKMSLAELSLEKILGSSSSVTQKGILFGNKLIMESNCSMSSYREGMDSLI